MTYLSEDPTYVAGALGLLAGAFLMALKVTQQGKYLVWALSTLGLTLALVVIEHFWVTDNERIEAVVYDLKTAVVASDVDGVLKHMTPDVEYVQGGAVLSGEATQGLIRANLANTAFDFIHIQDLQISAGRQTRRGKAEFHVYAKGTLRTSLASYNVGTANSTWSLGFQETSPGTWKVNRITPVSLPDGAISVPSLASPYGIRPSGETRQRTPGPTLLESRRLRSAGAGDSPRHPATVPLPPRRDELR
jgi:ketosteroid isomerase-like protein